MGQWRRWTFVVWVALTFLAATYMLLAEPFAQYFRSDMWVVGAIVPPLMILLLSIGIGWLVWLATSSRKRRKQSANTRSSDPGAGIPGRT